MDISAIIYAAIGGALGGGLGTTLGRLFDKSKEFKSLVTVGLTAGVVVLGDTCTNILYKNMTLPRIIPLETADLVEGLPVLKYIREQNLTVFNELIYPIDKAVRNNGLTQETLNSFRKTLKEVLDEKKREASAKALRGEYEVAIDLYEQMKEKAPVVCTQKFHGRPFQNLSPLLSAEYLEKEQRAMSNYFILPNRPVDFQVNLKTGEDTFNELVQKAIVDLEIANTNPSDDDLSENTVAEHRKICDFHIMLNKKILMLDDTTIINTQLYLAAQ